jgi:hypothetical protein
VFGGGGGSRWYEINGVALAVVGRTDKSKVSVALCTASWFCWRVGVV